MKKSIKNYVLLLLTAPMFFASCQTSETNWVDKALKVSEAQLEKAAETYLPEKNPRSVEPDGSIRYAVPRDWTSGFFPGSLWYMYEITKSDKFRQQAERFTEALDSIKNLKDTHDLGFMLYCSYGNGLRLTQKEGYKEVLLTGAGSLASRFNPKVGCIRSWDFGDWQFPVIVDNMMNLEYICWAGKVSGDAKYKDIAISHATKTMNNHFRGDFSSYHVVSYDTITGNAIQKQTFQGYADESAWARGQAWGLYGYTMMYRETGKPEFLEQAKHIASFIMNNKNTPEDKIPYWDYNAPDIPNAPRDASAAAVTASALIELSGLVPDGKAYFKYAEDILKSLSSETYLAQPGTNGLFILKHSVGALPKNSEIDVPINYADYYFLEALIRYKALLKQ